MELGLLSAGRDIRQRNAKTLHFRKISWEPLVPDDLEMWVGEQEINGEAIKLVQVKAGTDQMEARSMRTGQLQKVL